VAAARRTWERCAAGVILPGRGRPGYTDTLSKSRVTDRRMAYTVLANAPSVTRTPERTLAMPRYTGPLGFLLLVASLAAPARAEPLRVVMLGDSITKGVRPGVKPEETFSALIEKQLQQQGIRVSVVNAGVGGETTVGAGKRLAKE